MAPGRSSHPQEDLSFLPHDVHCRPDPGGVGWWGLGSSGSLRTKQDPRFLGDPEQHKEQLAASREPFSAGSTALPSLRKGPLSKERPHSTGALAPHPATSWTCSREEPLSPALVACSDPEVQSLLQFITTLVLNREIFSTTATTMS